MKKLLLLALLAATETRAQNRSILTDTIALDGVTVFSRSQSELFSRDSARLLQELKAMLEADQRFRKNRKTYMEHIAEQNAIDSANMLRLMEITELYGFPSMRRFKASKENILPHVIFVHTPRKYCDTVKPVVERLFKNGSITQAEYAHTMWHLNGRQDIPEIEGARVKRKKNGKVIQKIKEPDTL
jgi:hypothetical protein